MFNVDKENEKAKAIVRVWLKRSSPKKEFQEPNCRVEIQFKTCGRPETARVVGATYSRVTSPQWNSQKVACKRYPYITVRKIHCS